MGHLSDQYSSHQWFRDAREYLLSRQTAIQERLEFSFRFVDLRPENRSTFSYEYASLLRDCASVFGSVMDAITIGARNNNARTNFGDYRDLLVNEDADIYKRSVQVRPLFPNGMVVPLKALQSHNGVPQWWRAHNAVKHSEYENYHQGNLGNVVTALAALIVLEVFLDVGRSDGLWVNVGIAYPDASADMSAQRRLFPDSE